MEPSSSIKMERVKLISTVVTLDTMNFDMEQGVSNLCSKEEMEQ